MIRLRTAFLVCAAGVLATLSIAAAAQDPEPRAADPSASASAVPLRALPPARVELLRGLTAGPDEGCFDSTHWRERLLQGDLELRELAFEELIQRISRCAEGQRVMQEWAQGSEPELAWSARLALRELRRSPSVRWIHVADLSAPPLTQPNAGHIETSEPSDSGLHLRHFPGLVEGMFAQGGGLSLHRPRTWTLPPAHVHELPTPKGVEGRQGYSLRMGEGGVSLEIVQQLAEDETRRTFTGANLEQILEANPELRALLQVRSHSEGSPHALMIGGVIVTNGRQPAGDYLGVECEPLSAERARLLEIDPSCGLVVERMMPGSIAACIELQRGDVLLELNGRKLRTSADLRAAIHGAVDKGRVVVRLVDGEGQTRTLSWEPAEDEGSPAPTATEATGSGR